MVPIPDLNLRTLQGAIERAPFGIAIGNEEGDLIFANDNALHMWGIENESQVAGKSVISFLEDEEQAQIMLDEVKSKGEWTGTIETTNTDGERKHIKLTAYSMNESGVPARIMFSLIDITDQHHAKNQAENLNSLLKAIRTVNRLIVQDLDFSMLLDRTCEALVENISYKGCFITLIDESEKIQLVSQAGQVPMKSNWNIQDGTVEECAECIKETIRSNKIQVFDSSSNCEDCEFNDGNYKLAIAPMREKSSVIGTVGILIDRTLELQQEELDLLQEVARDLVFARSKKKTEEARKRAESELRLLVDQLESRVAERTEDLQEANHALQERVKEMTSLSTISDLVRDFQRPIEETFPEIIEAIQEGWQYPSLTEVRIVYGDEEYKSPEYVEKRNALTSTSQTKDGTDISLSVIYTESRPEEDIGPFLNEEKSLLDEIAHQIAENLSRRRAELALQESEELLRTAIDSAAVGMVMVSPKGPFLRVNKAFSEITGYSEDELLDMEFNDVTHPGDIEIGTKIVREIVSGEKERGTIYKRYVRKDGRIIQVKITTTLIRDSEGEPLHFFTLVEDITERKKLRENYELIANAIPGGLVHVMDKDFRYLFNAGELLEPLGLSNEMLIGKSIYDVLPPATVGLVEENYKRVLQGERVEYEAQYGDRSFLIRAIPIRNSNDEVERILVLSLDITERRAAKEALRKLNKELEERIEERTRKLRESEKLYRTIIETMPNAITVANSDLEVIIANKWAYKNHALKTSEEMTNVSVLDLVTIDDRARAEEIARRVIEEGVVRNQEFDMVREDGTTFPALVNLSTVKDENGELLYFIAVTTDITERKELQQRVINNEKLAALGKLSGSVAHDLRNPLGAINNSVYFLRMALEEPDEDVEESLDIIEKEVSNSQDIIEDLLRFARPIEPKKNLLNIKDIIEVVLDRTNPPDNIEIEKHMDDDLPVISADRVKLERVFHNLVNNAIEAMPNGGEVSISLENESPEGILITVSDTGTGISEENLKKIFEPLYTTKSKGIGLGLSIVQSIIQSHGGTIDVESEIGKGTEFRIWLPLE